MEPLLTDSIIRIGILILALAVTWIVLRALLRLAVRVFFFGCGLILVLGVVLLVLQSI